MADESMVVSLFKHEMNRIIRDRISRSSDLNWFDEIMEKTIAQVSKMIIFTLCFIKKKGKTKNNAFSDSVTCNDISHTQIVV